MYICPGNVAGMEEMRNVCGISEEKIPLGDLSVDGG
jgi:hypothetical protein